MCVCECVFPEGDLTMCGRPGWGGVCTPAHVDSVIQRGPGSFLALVSTVSTSFLGQVTCNDLVGEESQRLKDLLYWSGTEISGL